MMLYHTIETERLTIRELTLDDREAVWRHFASAEVTEFMDIEPCRDLAEAEEIIRFHLEDTGTRWGLFEKDGGALVGTIGYHCWVQSEARAEIGFDLAREFWGQGLMQEALRPVLAFGFGNMGLRLIEATVEPPNERCLKLMERLGFAREEQLRDGLVYLTLGN
ncbi:ribosomal-protein-alanine N-acetyltransferase [Tumebacillus sp. BK434]|uniref:GNAT family N-acetyltransferase n=1 Tax=Tumebacillus sp. BK434 TaxID=2512169 RepID=UPI0010D38980|nr:GNAT family N-acetyltransferase [Tumebacillus sp. BK434]TCP52175.1 ribosomal-protein-alanine N-acetyltransferase [Tumebacillus sp. BK434]